MAQYGVVFVKPPNNACEDFDRGCVHPNKKCKMRGKLVKVVCVVDYNKMINKGSE